MRRLLVGALCLITVGCDRDQSPLVDDTTKMIERTDQAKQTAKWREDCIAQSPNPRAMERLMCAVAHPWSVTDSKDPITDKRTVVVDTSTTRRIGQADGWHSEPELFLRCADGNIDVFIAWHEFVASDSADVIYRLDKGSPVTSRWSMSTNKTSTFLPAKDVAGFLDSLRGREDLAIRVTKSDSTELTGEIKVADSQHALDAIHAACPPASK